MNNDILHIRQLHEAYYRGETSVGQERELKEYFATATEVPAELKADCELFLSLEETAVPEGLEDMLIRMIDAQPRRPKLSPLHRWAGMVAAVAVVGVGIGLAVSVLHYKGAQIMPSTQEPQYYTHLTGNDLSPEQVEKQTIAAVELLARTLRMSEGYSDMSQ